MVVVRRKSEEEEDQQQQQQPPPAAVFFLQSSLWRDDVDYNTSDFLIPLRADCGALRRGYGRRRSVVAEDGGQTATTNSL